MIWTRYLKNAIWLLLSPIVPTNALILQSNLPDSPLTGWKVTMKNAPNPLGGFGAFLIQKKTAIRERSVASAETGP